MVGGAANFRSWLLEKEGFSSTSYLLLSSGDNWTGPAISTWFAGAPMVEAFNILGYDAIAIGNHEFDFGRSVMLQRFDASDAPYLGANIRDIGTQRLPFFAVPYLIKEIDGVSVGILGLANEGTHTCTHPLSTIDVDFLPYAEVIDHYVPKMRKEGVEVVVIIAHECRQELTQALMDAKSKVDAVFGAHCHNQFNTEVRGIRLMGSGWALRSYSKLTLRYDKRYGEVVATTGEVVNVGYPEGETNPVVPDESIQRIVKKWRGKSKPLFHTKVGYAARGLNKGSWPMANWVADSWLWAFPEADASIVVFGGMRQFIGKGPITLSEILGVLPFENTLMVVTLTGAELHEVLAYGASHCKERSSSYPAVGGLRYGFSNKGLQIEFLDGRKIEPEALYTVVITDYMMFGGSGYPFQDIEGDVDFTGINWREPVLEWLQTMKTSPQKPLETLIDTTPRNTYFSNK